MASRITPDEVSRFITLYQAGKNTPEIAELTGRSLRAVCYSLRNAGIELRAEQPTQTPRELEDLAVRMYQDGSLRAAIAVALSTDGGTINRILRRRLGSQPDWSDPERQAKRARIWGNPANQPFRASQETEGQILALYRSGMIWNDIVAEAGVSIKTVSNVLARRGIERSRAFKTTPEQRREIIRLHGAGVGVQAISQAIGITEDATRQFTAYGRESAFTAIDTPEAAYWLGFINADGAIVGVNPGTLRLQVVLARKDREHLVKLRSFTGTKRDIWDYEAKTIGGIQRPYSRLICQDRAIVMDLIRHGVHPSKTGKETAWNGPANLMPHFWRGMVDGDGSVPGKSYTVTLVGSYEVVAAFTTWLRGVSRTQVNPTRDKRSPDHWRVVVGGHSDVRAILHALYDDAPVALARKKALADLAVHGKPVAATLL